MNTSIISYSMTGNNDALAARLAQEIGAEHVRITEPKNRTNRTIFMDLIFNHNPKINLSLNKIEKSDLLIFVGPVWIGQVATPIRSCFKLLKGNINKYAFISISGGADSPDCNKKLPQELKKKLGKDPEFILDFHIADFLPSDPKPTRDMTSQYHITDKDVSSLVHSIKSTLNEKFA